MPLIFMILVGLIFVYCALSDLVHHWNDDEPDPFYDAEPLPIVTTRQLVGVTVGSDDNLQLVDVEEGSIGDISWDGECYVLSIVVPDDDMPVWVMDPHTSDYVLDYSL